MKFFKWSSNDPLKISKYGIPEPFGLKSVDPDILLVPIVAFDKNFYRVGYGGVYYDRFIRKIKKKKRVFTIGLAFSFQKTNKFNVDKYDQKLDFVLTEKNKI